jgi:quercetin dioxygenase-like cupin family protein
MRKSRAAGLLLLATATLAQQQEPVEITSEPSHHQVLENEYVRVFDVTVAPKASTLIHQHNHDYLFVTLGDSDVVSKRPGEKPVSLKLKDGEARFTPGNFAHAAINNSDNPFHNITIELLKPSTNVKTCDQNCADFICAGICPAKYKLISADQWTVWMLTMPPKSQIGNLPQAPQLIVPVSKLEFGVQPGSADTPIKRVPGQIDWLPNGLMHSLTNNGGQPARFVVLEFNSKPGFPVAGVARSGAEEKPRP